ncbi:hypothetical protein GCM10011399_06670 [Subtercola lobariae]|uniref:NYN domain-containing protein n=1 Tax=Subtercola lobariae TaxID=1588641 RepID=A0A917B1W3_9MICO|nr:hypothetical protein GCM10011399_06670 [Subtercola lobariae]
MWIDTSTPPRGPLIDWDCELPSKAIAYVDGFNLYNGIHDAFQHRYLWLDLVKLLENLRPANDLVTVKYFTSTLLDEPDAQGRQAEYIGALEAKYPGRIEVVMGRYQRKKMVCKVCGVQWTSYEEKETDVNIAVEIVSDALAGKAQSLYVISADSDLTPAIKLIQRHQPTVFAMAFFPPRRKSDELLKLMPSSIVIGRQKLRDAQLPEIVTTDSRAFARPAKWRPALFEDAGPIDLASLGASIPKPGAHVRDHQGSR